MSWQKREERGDDFSLFLNFFNFYSNSIHQQVQVVAGKNYQEPKNILSLTKFKEEIQQQQYANRKH